MVRMAHHALPSDVRASLTRLAERSDRAHPLVFAGRDQEFELLDSAVYGAQHGGAGRTVVVQGIPGAGKTSLLNEYANRLYAHDREGQPPVIPVPLRPGDLNLPPAAIIEEIDRQLCAPVAVNGTVPGARTLFASLTKRDFSEFRPSARAPASLPRALNEYASFRVGRKGSTIMLLVDEAQNLEDTRHVRAHLDALHGGVRGHTRMLLACFGLTNTAERLRTLGLARLASEHARTIGQLTDAEASRVVVGTLNLALAGYPFDHDVQRRRWIDEAAYAILGESANFPVHLTNGCRGLAEIVLNEGVGAKPPDEALRRKCRGYRDEYYNARLAPWRRHTIALASAFDAGDSEWIPASDVARSLMASDNWGLPVDQAAAVKVMDELRDNGYVEERNGSCRLAIASLTRHLRATLDALPSDNEAARLVLDGRPR